MAKLLILSGYNVNRFLLPFGESVKEILCNSFKKLNVDAEHRYFDEYHKQCLVKDGYGNINLFNHCIIFLMPPEYFYGTALKKINKNNNIFIFWNFEPFYVVGSPGKKFVKRRELMDKIFADPVVDKIWFYDKSEAQVYNNSKCIFVPLGYHECLEIKEIKKCNKRAYIFLGALTGRRKMFFSLIRSKLARSKKVQFGKRSITYDKVFRNNRRVVEELSRFRIGMDICAHDFNLNQVRWHRLILYAAAQVVIFSDCHLEEFGFKHGEHYFYCAGSLNCASLLDQYFRDNKKLNKIQNNMKNKLKKDYYMPTILRKALGH